MNLRKIFAKKDKNSLQKENQKLPEIFKPLLWSFDFSRVNPDKNKKTIIVNTINYGNLIHWRWIVGYYGKMEIKKVLEEIPATELRTRVRRLAALVFDIKDFNYASRGVKR